MIPFSQPNGLRFRGIGKTKKAAANDVTVIEFDITECCIINGGEFFSLGAGGDYITAEVILKQGDNVTVLDKFIDTWYLNTQSSTKIELPYFARLAPGLTVRVSYHNFHNAEEDIFVNLYLHKTKETFTIQDLLAG